ncbi:hypothetical protein D3C78_988310 [compost metagenome]
MLHAVKPANQLQNRTFPAAAWPDKRNGMASMRFKANAGKNIPILLVGKPYIQQLKWYGSSIESKLLATRGLKRQLQHLKQSLGRSLYLLNLRGQHRCHGERLHKEVEHVQEQQHAASAQLSLTN